MIPVSQCLDFTSLTPDEIFLGASLTARHHALLSSYRFNLDRGAIAVREMIIADLRSFLDMGARQRAADLLLVLRMFLSEHPQALCVVRGVSKLGPVPFASNIVHEDRQEFLPTPVSAAAFARWPINEGQAMADQN